MLSDIGLGNEFLGTASNSQAAKQKWPSETTSHWYTWEAESGRLEIQGQPVQVGHETTISKISDQKGLEV
jgi:hypothetical protein